MELAVSLSSLSKMNENGNTCEGREEDKHFLEIAQDGQTEPNECGWGILVCIGTFWFYGTTLGLFNSFGLFYKEIIDEFTTPENVGDINFKTALIFSLAIFIQYVVSPVAGIALTYLPLQRIAILGSIVSFGGILCTSFAPKIEIMYITFGILFAAGSGFVNICSFRILGEYFHKHLGTVNGLTNFSSSFFTIIYPFPISVLLKNIGFRHTMQVISVLFLLTCLLTLTWIPAKKKAVSSYASASKESLQISVKTWKEKFTGFIGSDVLWTNKTYMFLLIGALISLSGNSIPYVQLLKFVDDKKLPGSDGKRELVLLVIGGAAAAGRIAVGKIADTGVNRIRLVQLSFMASGLCVCMIPLMPNFNALITVVAIFGFFDGHYLVLISPIVFDLMPREAASRGIGFGVGISIIKSVGPIYGGLLRDTFGTYEVAFYMAGLLFTTGGLVLFIPLGYRNRK